MRIMLVLGVFIGLLVFNNQFYAIAILKSREARLVSPRESYYMSSFKTMRPVNYVRDYRYVRPVRYYDCDCSSYGYDEYYSCQCYSCGC